MVCVHDGAAVDDGHAATSSERKSRAPNDLWVKMIEFFVVCDRDSKCDFQKMTIN